MKRTVAVIIASVIGIAMFGTNAGARKKNGLHRFAKKYGQPGKTNEGLRQLLARKGYFPEVSHVSNGILITKRPKIKIKKGPLTEVRREGSTIVSVARKITLESNYGTITANMIITKDGVSVMDFKAEGLKNISGVPRYEKHEPRNGPFLSRRLFNVTTRKIEFVPGYNPSKWTPAP